MVTLFMHLSVIYIIMKPLTQVFGLFLVMFANTSMQNRIAKAHAECQVDPKTSVTEKSKLAGVCQRRRILPPWGK